MDIEIEFKYKACVVKYYRSRSGSIIYKYNCQFLEEEKWIIWHSRSLFRVTKNPTKAKSRQKWSPENRGPTTAPRGRIRAQGKEKDPLAGAMWTPAMDLK